MMKAKQQRQKQQHQRQKPPPPALSVTVQNRGLGELLQCVGFSGKPTPFGGSGGSSGSDDNGRQNQAQLRQQQQQQQHPPLRRQGNKGVAASSAASAHGNKAPAAAAPLVSSSLCVQGRAVVGDVGGSGSSSSSHGSGSGGGGGGPVDARAGDVDDLIAVARMLEEEDGELCAALGIDGRQIDAQEEALLDATRRMRRSLKHPPPPPKHANAKGNGGGRRRVSFFDDDDDDDDVVVVADEHNGGGAKATTAESKDATHPESKTGDDAADEPTGATAEASTASSFLQTAFTPAAKHLDRLRAAEPFPLADSPVEDSNRSSSPSSSSSSSSSSSRATNNLPLLSDVAAVVESGELVSDLDRARTARLLDINSGGEVYFLFLRAAGRGQAMERAAVLKFGPNRMGTQGEALAYEVSSSSSSSSRRRRRRRRKEEESLDDFHLSFFLSLLREFVLCGRYIHCFHTSWLMFILRLFSL